MKTETPAFIVALNETPMQEIFNTVITHLRKQGIRAGRIVRMSSIGPEQIQCQYRGDNGTKCAVGCLIPDDEYSPRIEGASIGGLITFADLEMGRHRMLASLQGLHDGHLPDTIGDDDGRFERRVQEIAKELDLTIPEGSI